MRREFGEADITFFGGVGLGARSSSHSVDPPKRFSDRDPSP